MCACIYSSSVLCPVESEQFLKADQVLSTNSPTERGCRWGPSLFFRWGPSTHPTNRNHLQVPVVGQLTAWKLRFRVCPGVVFDKRRQQYRQIWRFGKSMSTRSNQIDGDLASPELSPPFPNQSIDIGAFPYVPIMSFRMHCLGQGLRPPFGSLRLQVPIVSRNVASWVGKT